MSATGSHVRMELQVCAQRLACADCCLDRLPVLTARSCPARSAPNCSSLLQLTCCFMMWVHISMRQSTCVSPSWCTLATMPFLASQTACMLPVSVWCAAGAVQDGDRQPPRSEPGEPGRSGRRRRRTHARIQRRARHADAPRCEFRACSSSTMVLHAPKRSGCSSIITRL